MMPAEPFAEIPQLRGEHGLVGVWSVAIRPFACDVAHAFDTRDVSAIASFPPPRPADHTQRVWASQESALRTNCLKTGLNRGVAAPLRTALRDLITRLFY